MSISFINSGNGDLAGAAFDATGADLLVVAYSCTNETGPGGTRLGVSFNGVEMEFVNYANSGSGGFDPSKLVTIYMYYLLAPASGSHTITSTAGGAGTWLACAYSGTKQSIFESTGVNSCDPDTNLALTVTPITDSSWIISAFNQVDSNFVDGINFTTRVFHSGSFDRIGDSNGRVGATTVTSNGTDTGAGRLCGIAASFAPAFQNTNLLPLL